METNRGGEANLAGLEWYEGLSVGVREFDDHHRKLIGLMTRLRSTLLRDEDGNTVREVLTELSHYTIYHFKAEEALMEQYGYPELMRHRAEHQALTEKTLLLLGDAYETQQDIGKETLTFLVAWLRDHILTVDRRYAAFFAGKGIT